MEDVMVKLATSEKKWNEVEHVIKKHYHQPDLQAARALYSAVGGLGRQNTIFPANWIWRCAPVCDWNAARETEAKELLAALWFGSPKFG